MKQINLIFGKAFSFEYSDKVSKTAVNSLQKQIGYYSFLENKEATDVRVMIRDSFSHKEAIAVNSTHEELEDGFVVNYVKWSISYRLKNNEVYSEVVLNKETNPFLRFLKRVNNIEFLTLEERLRQIVNENVLLPALYFFPDRALIHCSAIKNPGGEGILIGGKGGTGKTSLSMRLCREEDYSFICDDMSILTATGLIEPNMAFPKIYAYNVRGNKAMDKVVRNRMSNLEKIVWSSKRFLLGDNRVRISIPPDILYPEICKKPVRAARYYILDKQANSPSLTSQEINAELGADISAGIIEREYAEFNSHLKLHEIFCHEHNKAPIAAFDSVKENWKKSLFSALSQMQCFRITIPEGLSHQETLKGLREVIS
jgi:hypothetical protein